MYAPAGLRSFRPRASGGGVTAVLALMLAATPAMGATYSASTGAASGTIHVPGPSNFDVYPTSPVPGSATSSSAITIGPVGSPTEVYMDAASSAFGQASTAAAHALATARAQTGLPAGAGSANASSSASAQSAFGDVFLLSAAGFTAGTTVRMTFAVNVSGSFGGDGTFVGGGVLSGASWQGTAFWRATTQVSSSGFEQAQQLSRNSTGDVILTGTGVLGTSVYTIDVPLGLTSVGLRAEASASAAASGFAHSADPIAVSAEVAFASDLSHTVAWGGILGLSTLDGIAITDFAAFSDSSGFDYKQAFASAVPEPGIAAMLAAGLALTGWLRRRRAA